MSTTESTDKATVLVVDDSPNDLSLIANLLRDDYRVQVANGAEGCMSAATARRPPDLILLDIMMPGMDGYEVCKRLKADPRTLAIPVIFLTGKTSVADEQQGFALGAVDYITKPVSPPIVLARVATHLALKASADFLRDKNAYLEQELSKRNHQMTAIQDVTILTMASMAETRDTETGNHIRRTQNYVKALATHLKPNPRFSAFLTDDNIDMLFKSAPLHDIGKVGIPDRILLKPGKLTVDEFEIMKTHTTLGWDAINKAEKSLGTQAEFLNMAKDIALCHQEKWDGSGYPQGLAGDAIPVAARLMAVADVYDALISRRVYKEGMPHEAAVAIILKGKGQHFDPDMVNAFFDIRSEFLAIAQRYADSEADVPQKVEKFRAAFNITAPGQLNPG
jgi:putative two-component system response regulator